MPSICGIPFVYRFIKILPSFESHFIIYVNFGKKTKGFCANTFIITFELKSLVWLPGMSVAILFSIWIYSACDFSATANE